MQRTQRHFVCASFSVQIIYHILSYNYCNERSKRNTRIDTAFILAFRLYWRSPWFSTRVCLCRHFLIIKHFTDYLET